MTKGKSRNHKPNGPIMVENVKVGVTAAETTVNQEFLEKALASI